MNPLTPLIGTVYSSFTELQKLPTSGKPHPSAFAVFLRPKFGPHSPSLPVFQRREGAEITPVGGILPAILLWFLNLPAPLFHLGLIT